MASEMTGAYKAGYDAGMNGPNTTNCHFSIFTTDRNTKEWERGKAAADAERRGMREGAKCNPHSKA